jgi:exopolysaccharide biosynthesis predicted pyruvyltransferase EpsI
MDLPPCVDVQVSPDLAFELGGTDFICKLREKLLEKYILIAMRRDQEGPAGILARTHARWLPKQVRKPLSKLRDRLTAYRSQDVVNEILRHERIPGGIPRIYRDVSEALSFDEFVHVISNSRTIITDRLHSGILGFLLNKRVILIPREDHKVKGVYELNMSGPNSRTTLWST